MNALLLPSIQFFGGLALLVSSAWLFIQGSTQLGIRFHIGPYLLSFTLLALGDCLPELTLCLNSASKGLGTLAVSGIVGSNAVNLLLILGIAAVYKPLVAPSWLQTQQLHIFLLSMLGVTFLLGSEWNGGLWALGQLNITDGLILLILFTLFVLSLLLSHANRDDKATDYQEVIPLWRTLLYLALGCTGIYLGGRWAIRGTTAYMLHFNVAQEVMGLLPVAIVVAVPEFLMLVDSARRNTRGEMLPALLISSIFNLLLVLGITSLGEPLPLYNGAALHWGLLIVGTIILTIALYVGHGAKRISRREGILLLLFYVGFVAWVIIRSGQSARVLF